MRADNRHLRAHAIKVCDREWRGRLWRPPMGKVVQTHFGRQLRKSGGRSSPKTALLNTNCCENSQKLSARAPSVTGTLTSHAKAAAQHMEPQQAFETGRSLWLPWLGHCGALAGSNVLLAGMARCSGMFRASAEADCVIDSGAAACP